MPNDPSISIFDKAVVLKVLPLGIFQFVGKFFLLSATLIIPVATVASVKALSPLLIVTGYRVLYRVRFPIVTYLLLTPLVAGVIMIITADNNPATPGEEPTPFHLLEFNEKHIKGLFFCVVSTVIMAGQQMYSKELITWESSSISNPASLVLNTDPSRPVSPAQGQDLQYSYVIDSGSTHVSLLLPKNIKKHFVQRAPSLRLPYSVSDLRLDEKKDQKDFQYDIEVQESKSSTNPFASLGSPAYGVRKPDKFTIIFYISLIGFVFSLGGFLANEALDLFRSIKDPSLLNGSLEDTKDLILVFVLVLLNSLSHFCQTVLAFLLLGSIPALSYSIASMMKRIVIIVVSITFAVENSSPEKWFGRISTLQMQGLGLIGLGLYCYDRWGSRSLKENRF